MIPTVQRKIYAERRIPRESGDDPVLYDAARLNAEYSPRERG